VVHNTVQLAVSVSHSLQLVLYIYIHTATAVCVCVYIKSEVSCYIQSLKMFIVNVVTLSVHTCYMFTEVMRIILGT
jgi:hypothetical protein